MTEPSWLMTKLARQTLLAENASLQASMKRYLETVAGSAGGGEALSRAGIAATRRESAAARRDSRARVDPGGQFGYETFKVPASLSFVVYEMFQ